MRASFATIPKRELLTYHDAYAYFAKTYDWDVIGAIQVSDFEDPTPKEVASLIDQVRDADVPAIFGSEVFPSPVLEQIGKEAGARYVDVLRDDDLPGAPGDAGALVGRPDALRLRDDDRGARWRRDRARGLRAAERRAGRGDVPAMSDPSSSGSKASRAASGRRTCSEAVDLTIPEGSLTGIVGPSGSGKTTLLRTIIGSHRPVAGSVVRRRDLRIAYVPQVETVDWSFPVTVARVRAHGPTRRVGCFRGRARAERAEARAVLERLRDRGARASATSASSRAVSSSASSSRGRCSADRTSLLLDEPTSGVDARIRHEILHLLGDLNDEGLTIVLTTHDLNGIATHLPRLVCLNRHVIAEGAPVEVLTPATLELTFGASMDVLVHHGVCVVVDAPHDAGVEAGHRHAEDEALR